VDGGPIICDYYSISSFPRKATGTYSFSQSEGPPSVSCILNLILLEQDVVERLGLMKVGSRSRGSRDSSRGSSSSRSSRSSSSSNVSSNEKWVEVVVVVVVVEVVVVVVVEGNRRRGLVEDWE